MNHNPEYDFEEIGDLVCWDTVYYTTTTSKKKVNIVYTPSEETENTNEHN